MNAAAIIQTNYPQETACLPPMVSNLLDLMKKLAELSGKDGDCTENNGLMTTAGPEIDMESHPT